MHGVPQPYAIQRVGDTIAAPAQQIEGDAGKMLESVAGPIQPLLTPDQGQQRAFHSRVNHGIGPSSRADAYGRADPTK